MGHSMVFTTVTPSSSSTPTPAPSLPPGSQVKVISIGLHLFIFFKCLQIICFPFLLLYIFIYINIIFRLQLVTTCLRTMPTSWCLPQPHRLTAYSHTSLRMLGSCSQPGHSTIPTHPSTTGTQPSSSAPQLLQRLQHLASNHSLPITVATIKVTTVAAGAGAVTTIVMTCVHSITIIMVLGTVI